MNADMDGFCSADSGRHGHPDGRYRDPREQFIRFRVYTKHDRLWQVRKVEFVMIRGGAAEQS